MQYIQPQHHARLSAAELLVIDEAAAIPLPLVKAMLGPYLVFLCSTVNGYEGALAVSRSSRASGVFCASPSTAARVQPSNHAMNASTSLITCRKLLLLQLQFQGFPLAFASRQHHLSMHRHRAQPVAAAAAAAARGGRQALLWQQTMNIQGAPCVVRLEISAPCAQARGAACR